jgi:hypothetical protein
MARCGSETGDAREGRGAGGGRGGGGAVALLPCFGACACGGGVIFLRVLHLFLYGSRRGPRIVVNDGGQVHGPGAQRRGGGRPARLRPAIGAALPVLVVAPHKRHAPVEGQQVTLVRLVRGQVAARAAPREARLGARKWALVKVGGAQKVVLRAGGEELGAAVAVENVKAALAARGARAVAVGCGRRLLAGREWCGAGRRARERESTHR